jgi:uncharacterized membrane protein
VRTAVSAGTMARFLVANIMVLTLAFLLLPVPLTGGLEDGRIGVLYVGCIARSRPFWNMRRDPMFSVNFVQATMRDWGSRATGDQAAEGEGVRRLVRLYMPRTYSQLVESFDVIVLSNANRFAVGPENTEILARAVREGGLGLLMSGGWESFGGHNNPAWGSSSIGELLPTVDVEGIWVDQPRNNLIMVPVAHDNELMSSLPWEEESSSMRDFHHNLVDMKQGARLLARVRSTTFDDHPGMVVWELNKVRILALTGEIHRFCTDGIWWGYDFGTAWDYGYDFGSNMMIYLDGRPVPQDVQLVHSVRSKMSEVETRRSLLIALLDFCESFGANTQRVVAMFDDMDLAIAEALPEYLDLRFDEVLETYRTVEGMLEEAEAEAVRLKKRTLLWVYVIEWLVVTGTTTLCGFLLWTLMVRRRLYREVVTTRFPGQ